MTIVLDASASIEFLLGRGATQKIKKLLEDSAWVIAPDLYVSEVTNVLWKYFQFEKMEKVVLETLLERAMVLPDDIITTKDMAKEVFALSCLSVFSAYDLFYLVLARRHNATLVTMDRKFGQLAQKLHVDCIYF